MTNQELLGRLPPKVVAKILTNECPPQYPKSRGCCENGALNGSCERCWETWLREKCGVEYWMNVCSLEQWVSMYITKPRPEKFPSP